jgi:hypothetical protein
LTTAVVPLMTLTVQPLLIDCFCCVNDNSRGVTAAAMADDINVVTGVARRAAADWRPASERLTWAATDPANGVGGGDVNYWALTRRTDGGATARQPACAWRPAAANAGGKPDAARLPFKPGIPG